MNWPAEEWRDIAGSPGYRVSSRGAVKSPSGRVLSPWVAGYGYFYISLGRSRRASVHSLVCAAFHGPRPDGKVVAHRDGDGLNNSAENVRWATPSENMQDMIRHGRHNPRNFYKPGQKKRGPKPRNAERVSL
jgi:HNH endonuclease